MTVLTTVEELEAIYGVTNDASTVKVADHVTPLYRAFIEKSFSRSESLDAAVPVGGNTPLELS